MVGELVDAGVFCAGAEDAGGAGLLSLLAGAHGADVAVGVVVLVGVEVVVVVEVTGSHGSDRDGVSFPGESPGWAILTATGVVTRNSAVVEIAKARVSACLRPLKYGADFKAIRYPSSSTWQSAEH